MHYTLLTTALELAALTSASALSNSARDSSLLRLPISAVRHAPRLSERQDNVQVTNLDHGTAYIVDVFVGTPKQPVSLMLDTGSSSVWVNPECATSGSVQYCESLPRFDWQKSTTLVNEGIAMNLSYEAGYAQGTFVTDDFTIGNYKITKQEVGVADNTAEWPWGIMGVGPISGSIAGGTGHPTVIDNLASQGFTKSRAFSLDLRDVDSPVGSVIFGGVDTKKYKGALEKLPIIPAAQAPDRTPRYWVNMKSMGITKPGQAPKTYSQSGIPVFLDCGSSIANLPTFLVNQILADFPGATYLPEPQIYQIDCSFATQDGTVNFGFGDIIFNVPYSEFIMQQSSNFCYLGTRINDEISSLGDTFLRAAYVVYDEDNSNIHLAPAADCGSNLVEIGVGPDAVPSIVGGCGKPTTTTTTTTTSSKAKTTSVTSRTTVSTAMTTTTTTTAPGTTSVPTYPVSTYATSTYPVSSPGTYPAGNATASYSQTTTEAIGQSTTPCPETTTYPVGTGSGSPVRPTYTTVPPYTGNAGKATTNILAALLAAMAAVMIL